jgi:hypothetical protein
MSHSAVLADVRSHIAGNAIVRQRFLGDSLRRRDVNSLVTAVAGAPLSQRQRQEKIPVEVSVKHLHQVLSHCLDHNFQEQDILALWESFQTVLRT